MKKLTVLLAMTMLLAACGGNSEPEKKETVNPQKTRMETTRLLKSRYRVMMSLPSILTKQKRENPKKSLATNME
ncbi:MAG: hypothetical protein ACLTQJ_18665 [[Clostridium] innocuum]